MFSLSFFFAYFVGSSCLRLVILKNQKLPDELTTLIIGKKKIYLKNLWDFLLVFMMALMMMMTWYWLLSQKIDLWSVTTIKYNKYKTNPKTYYCSGSFKGSSDTKRHEGRTGGHIGSICKTPKSTNSYCSCNPAWLCRNPVSFSSFLLHT